MHRYKEKIDGDKKQTKGYFKTCNKGGVNEGGLKRKGRVWLVLVEFLHLMHFFNGAVALVPTNLTLNENTG